MKSSMNTSRYLLLAAAVAALGCGTEAVDRTSAAELAGGRAGEIALIPAVEVDGLEELDQRSHGTVFVDEVLLNARSVRIRDTSGRDRQVSSSGRYLLRYSPAAGESGLSRIWAPADAEYTDLALDVGPLFATEESLREESRARGFDVSLLRNASTVVRGFIAVEGRKAHGLGSEGQALSEGRGCVGNDALACEGTVPDTAPARVRPTDEKARTDNGTVPDTAPARDEMATANQGLQANLRTDGQLPSRSYIPFVMVTNGSFTLGTELDPVVNQGGGVVKLHLDANALFSDERLAELANAAEEDPEGITSTLRPEEVSTSVHVEAGEVVTISGPRPR
ncbi:MAG: hypothetical protein AB2A00_27710 [Myxococcota bacterium]